MYNLRYHLVTICSIFLALAIGLLLGAAIAGSDLVRDTSQGLVDSLLEEFNDITQENNELTKQIEVERPLTQQLLGYWQDGQLVDRTVVVLSGDSASDTELSQQTSQMISDSGGVPVTITVKVPEFGLTDATITESLQQVIPVVDGEPYTTTIGKALVDEWTYDGLLAAVATEQNGSSAEGSTADESNASGSTTSSSTTNGSSTNASSVPDVDTEELPTITKRLILGFPLTSKLVDLDCITITVDYKSFIAANSDKMTTRQKQTWTEADEDGLPYAVNGLVNLLTVSNDENSASIADPVGLQITRYIDNLGTAGDLPVYQWKTTTDANAMEGGDDQSSAGEAATGILDQIGDGEVTASDDVDPTTLGRYAVLAQVKGRANSFIDAATQMGLSCVTTLDDASGEYSLVALLSGARKGIYGSDRPADAHFPTLP